MPAIWYEEISIFGNTGIDGIFGLSPAYWDSEGPVQQQTVITPLLLHYRFHANYNPVDIICPATTRP